MDVFMLLHSHFHDLEPERVPCLSLLRLNVGASTYTFCAANNTDFWE